MEVTPKLSGVKPWLDAVGSGWLLTACWLPAGFLLAAGFTLHVPIVLVHLRRAVAIATLQSDLPNFCPLPLLPPETFGPACRPPWEQNRGWRRPWSWCKGRAVRGQRHPLPHQEQAGGVLSTKRRPQGTCSAREVPDLGRRGAEGRF